MLDANRIADLKEISKYGKSKGYLMAKRYNLPTYSNFYIVENENEVQLLLAKHKEQKDFCMRSDTSIGNVPLSIHGANGNRNTIFEYIDKIKKKSNELGVNGVALIYWNDGKFCKTYEIDGCFYLYYRIGKELIIDYVGKGWDGSYLSHGTACHETYVIPWEEVLFLDDNHRNVYRKQVISEYVYSMLRKSRIQKLMKDFRLSLQTCKQVVPSKYSGIKNEYFRQVINQVILPMYDNKDLQTSYNEYIVIVQIENDRVLVPEIILPERLSYKGKNK